MPSPCQQLETRDVGHGKFMWKKGRGLPLEKPGLKIGPRPSKFEAQVDEHIAKSLIAQRKLIAFCRRMTTQITGATVTDPGIKKRPNIVEKVEKRGKQVHEVNDVARATVTFHHLEEVFAADAWVQEQPEFERISVFTGSPYKNRYTKDSPDGIYRDVKMFLAFDVEGSHYPWIVELQLNLKVAVKNKGIGHGIYEITRLGDAIPKNRNLPIPAGKVMRIAQKLRHCYVALKDTGVDKSLLARFVAFIDRHFREAIDNLEKKNYQPRGCTITPRDRKLLDKVSLAIYTYSFKVARQASAIKGGSMQKLIGPDGLAT